MAKKVLSFVLPTQAARDRSVYRQTPIRRVGRKRPCPICKKPDWCGISENGEVALCMRESGGAVRVADNGAHVHRLTGASFISSLKPTEDTQAEALETIDKRDAVYRSMLENLPLSGEHADHLERGRGLMDTTIVRNLYASVPQGDKQRAELVKTLVGEFETLAGIPGFYREDGRWTLVSVPPGFFIPIRDERGRIQALQIRRDAGGSRYMWLSSVGKPFGVSSGSPIHFAHSWQAETEGLIITEGALKADIIADKLNAAAVVGLPGVSAFPNDIGHELRRIFPKLVNAETVIAYDSDAASNPTVEWARQRLADSLLAAGRQVYQASWSNGKGLDDCLIEAERMAA